MEIDSLKNMKQLQTTKNILLIRPANFMPNEQTRHSNAFQKLLTEYNEVQIKELAIKEFDNFVSILSQKNINVYVIDDTLFPVKPDAIFPNNWITFHPDGTVILYPLLADNRRTEKRHDIFNSLKKHFQITRIIDISDNEEKNIFLEGTGSIVFDHINKVAYACLSPRTNRELFVKICKILNYKPISFHSHDKAKNEIYHTNVMMCIGEKFSIICLESISDTKEKDLIVHSLSKSGHQIIDITLEQMQEFAGNMLQLSTNDNKAILALSQSAYNSLNIKQKNEIGKSCELVPLPIKIIETIGGGSARCMIAEIFLEHIK